MLTSHWTTRRKPQTSSPLCVFVFAVHQSDFFMVGSQGVTGQLTFKSKWADQNLNVCFCFPRMWSRCVLKADHFPRFCEGRTVTFTLVNVVWIAWIESFQWHPTATRWWVDRLCPGGYRSCTGQLQRLNSSASSQALLACYYLYRYFKNVAHSTYATTYQVLYVVPVIHPVIRSSGFVDLKC